MCFHRISSTNQNKGNEPFAVLIKETKPQAVQQIFIRAEKKELFEVSNESAVMEMALLVGCYYAFNIDYQRGKNFLLFLQGFVLGIPGEGKKNSNMQHFSSKLPARIKLACRNNGK